MSPKKKISILIIEDNRLLRDGISSIINEQPDLKVIAAFSDIEKSLSNIFEHNPDIVLIDLGLRNQNSLEVVETIKKKSCSTIWKDSFQKNKVILFQGVDDKLGYIQRNVVSSYGCFGESFTWDNVAYMGDAENDIECMEKAHYTGCPSDAIEEVKENSNYVSNYPGGKGCVYDFAMHILRERNKNGNFKS